MLRAPPVTSNGVIMSLTRLTHPKSGRNHETLTDLGTFVEDYLEVGEVLGAYLRRGLIIDEALIFLFLLGRRLLARQLPLAAQPSSGS